MGKWLIGLSTRWLLLIAILKHILGAIVIIIETAVTTEITVLSMYFIEPII